MMGRYLRRPCDVIAAYLVMICLLVCVAGFQRATSTESTSREEAPAAATRHVSEQARVRADSYERTVADKARSVPVADAELRQVVEVEPVERSYTVMVYMIGSNLESVHAAATRDLQEMLDAGVDFSQVNVVVYAGGSKRWNTDIPTGRNSVLDLSRPEGERIVAQTDEAISMGAPETLTSFMGYCANHYPASHNALIFWDHGGGPLWGFGHDELSEGDGLLLQELRAALEAGPYASSTGRRLDWVGFDACLMGSMENASLWRDYAGYLIASEEVEPGDGWDYSFLPLLGQEVSADAVGEAIVDAYASHYEDVASPFSNPDVTLACYDLSKAGSVMTALDNLLSAMTAHVANGGYGDISRARRASKAFGLSASGGRASGYDLVDLGDFAEQVRAQFADEAEALQDAIEGMVIHERANVERASGISLYVPGDNFELYEAYRQLEGVEGVRASGQDGEEGTPQGDEVASSSALTGHGDTSIVVDEGAQGPGGLGSSRLSPAHDEFVDTLAVEWLGASEVDWSTVTASPSPDGLLVHLAEEQADALASATYTLLTYNTPGIYSVRTADVAIYPDATGTLHVPADPLAIALKTDIGKETLSHFTQVEDVDGVGSYVNADLTLDAAGDFGGGESVNEDFSITVHVDPSTQEVSIGSLRIEDDSVGIGGKGTVDVSDYSHVWQPLFGASPAFDMRGQILPWDEWKHYSTGGSNAPIEEGFGFTVHPISYYGGSWACQVVLTDVNGNRHAIEPVDLQRGEWKTGDMVTRDTDLGSMEFELMADHAELVRYQGYDWMVDIPTEVEGLPVSVIGNHAFSGCSYLDELVVPEGVTSIGQSAFAETGLYLLTLPASLSHIAPAAFREMPYLERFAVAAGNDVVKAVDGVLFSADGKRLIAYPNARGSRYVVPLGVETIGYGAFAEADVEEVSLPEGLREVDRAAFFGCADLTSLKLPDSLGRIGALAFGRSSTSSVQDDTLAKVSQVHVGPNVEYIGPRAFSGLELESIEVDPANMRYASRDGALLNAAGDTLLELPWGDGSVFVVPEGVVALDPYVFRDYSNTRCDFVLPASLERCEPTCFPVVRNIGTEGDSYECVIHAPDGSYAQRFAQEYEIEHDANTDVGSLRHAVVQMDQDGYTLTASVFRDHAVLTGIDSAGNGLAEHGLALPREVSGVPLTAIDVRSGAWAAETLVIPETVESFGGRGLSGFSELRHIELDGANEHFRLIDGALLTDDGTTLVGYPRAWEGDFKIPDSVEVIGPHAFSYCKLTRIDLPPRVREIGESAFAGCESLETVEFNRDLEIIGRSAFSSCENLVLDAALPEGLESIGAYAFSGIRSCEGLELPSGIEHIGGSAFSRSDIKNGSSELLPMAANSLAVGAYLEQWGGEQSWGVDRAFEGVDFERFDVDEDNERYRGEGPFLLTKDGGSIVDFADGYAGEVHVPESARSMNGSVFSEAYRVTDVFIPDTIAAIRWPSERTEGGYDNALDTITVHVESGSYAERYARERGLPWVVE